MNTTSTPLTAHLAGPPARAAGHAPLPSQLAQELARLAPALEAFPVGALLGLLRCDDPHDHASAYRCVDHCLGHWIEALTAALQQPLGPRIESLARIDAQQREARDALASLRLLLCQAEAPPPGRDCAPAGASRNRSPAALS